jgi:hypothetical protein
MSYAKNTNALRARIIEANAPVSEVVENAVAISQDIDSLKVVQDQIARVSRNSIEALNTIKTSPMLAMSKLCTQLKEIMCSYIYTHDSRLSPVSEIESSVNYNFSKQPEKNPEVLKKRLDYDLSIPSLPGNIFYLAMSSNLESYNSDLYSLFNSKKLDPANSSKSEIELMLSCFPQYILPGYNSIPNVLKSTIAESLDLQKIKDDPSKNLFQLFSAYVLRTESDHNIFKAIVNLDTILKELDTGVCYQVLSIYTQQNVSAREPSAWMLKLKTLLPQGQSVVELLMSMFIGRETTNFGTDSFWWWFFDSNPIENTVRYPDQVSSIIQANPKFKDAVDKSFEATSDLLQSIKQDFITNAASTNSDFKSKLNSWKTAANQIGGPLGSQAIVLIICFTVLCRIEALSADSEATGDKIKILAGEGIKYSKYLFNGAHIANIFQVLGA